MKKKIFTLFCLSLVLSSFALSAFAQGINVNDYDSKGNWPLDGPYATPPAQGSFTGHGYVYVGPNTDGNVAEYTFDVTEATASAKGTELWLVLYITDGSTVLSQIDSVKYEASGDATTKVKYKFANVSSSYDGKWLGAAYYDASGTQKFSNPDIVLLYNTPIVSFSYQPATPLDPGKGVISVKNLADTSLLYSLTDGLSWFPAFEDDGTAHALTAGEISVLGNTILFKQPGAMSWVTIYIKGQEGDSPYPDITIARAVTLHGSTGVATVTSPNGVSLLDKQFYVESSKPFTFNVQLSDPKLQPVVSVTAGSETFDATTKSLGDGLWEVTVLGVNKASNISITTTAGIDAVATASVYSVAGTVYVSAASAGAANIYGATGALVKTVAVGAGETAVSLPAGLYIVTLDGKAYKVIVK
ncbi:MAG: hypothetical protein LBR50_08085 [Tannerella sp.]|nr:hypothetical protein [Tannerella sp.]